jgi:predicted nucleotidyltransferase
MSPEVSAQLVAELRETPGLVSAYLFGSAAAGLMHRESDLDVAVLLDRAMYPTPRDRFERRLLLTSALQRATRRAIDLVVLNDVPPPLARRIMADGVRLLSLDPAKDHAHRRLMLSRAADLEPFLRRTRAIKLRAIAR